MYVHVCNGQFTVITNYDIIGEILKQTPLYHVKAETHYYSQRKLLSYGDLTLVGEQLLA